MDKSIADLSDTDRDSYPLIQATFWEANLSWPPLFFGIVKSYTTTVLSASAFRMDKHSGRFFS